MTHRFHRSTALIAGILLSVGFLDSLSAQIPASVSGSTSKEAWVTPASGTFEVKLNPHPTAHDHAGAPLGRLSIDKQFQGDLVGISKGEMLSARTDVENSAGYVAIEQVSGTMTGGAPSLIITVVPDSGTGEPAGLSGTMTITIADGKHFYDFEYTLTPKS